MKYYVKGTLKLVVRRIVDVELDEVVDADYKADALDILSDRATDELKKVYPGCSIDVWTSQHVGIATLDIIS